jgi:hypothetical protein
VRHTARACCNCSVEISCSSSCVRMRSCLRTWSAHAAGCVGGELAAMLPDIVDAIVSRAEPDSLLALLGPSGRDQLLARVDAALEWLTLRESATPDSSRHHSSHLHSTAHQPSQQPQFGQPAYTQAPRPHRAPADAQHNADVAALLQPMAALSTGQAEESPVLHQLQQPPAQRSVAGSRPGSVTPLGSKTPSPVPAAGAATPSRTNGAAAKHGTKPAHAAPRRSNPANPNAFAMLDEDTYATTSAYSSGAHQQQFGGYVARQTEGEDGWTAVRFQSACSLITCPVATLCAEACERDVGRRLHAIRRLLCRPFYACSAHLVPCRCPAVSLARMAPKQKSKHSHSSSSKSSNKPL